MLLIGMVVLLGLATEFEAHDRVVDAGWAPPEAAWLGAAVLAGGIAAVVLPHAAAAGLAARRLGTRVGAGRGWLRLHTRLSSAAPLLLLGVFALALGAGWADLVRGWTGDAWILDDLVTLAPPLLATVAMDAASWPLVRRFREAVILRRADAGEPIHPVPARWAYALCRLRGGPGLLGVPLLLILGWTQGFDALLAAAWAPAWLPVTGLGVAAAVGAAGSLLMVALSPPLLVRVLPTVPMPAGPLRDDLLGFLASERVRARGLRLWLTGGEVANAALVGVLPQLRYLMLSDRLLESLPRDELLAVLAHETGHAIHRHLAWLGASALALGVVLLLTLDAVESRGWLDSASAEAAALGTAAAAWLVGFGWVSRRVEAQADAHAAAAGSGDGARFTPGGVAAISAALARVSNLAGSRENRRSYRHGSIASRRAALLRLLDHPDGEAPADAAMRLVKLGVLAVAVACLALWLIA